MKTPRASLLHILLIVGVPILGDCATMRQDGDSARASANRDEWDDLTFVQKTGRRLCPVHSFSVGVVCGSGGAGAQLDFGAPIGRCEAFPALRRYFVRLGGGLSQMGGRQDTSKRRQFFMIRSPVGPASFGVEIFPIAIGAGAAAYFIRLYKFACRFSCAPGVRHMHWGNIIFASGFFRGF